MANIYIISYVGGACGEWLTYQLGKDENYYPIGLQTQTGSNKYVIQNPLEELDIDIKSPYDATRLNITTDQRQAVEHKFNQKHLAVPTHYMDRLDKINLPRIKGIRLYFSHVTAPMFYTLLWIKTWVEHKPVDAKEQQEIIRCAEGDSGDKALLKIDTVMDKVDEIVRRKKVYAFEKSALRFGVRKSEDFVDRFYGFYFRYNLLRPADYTNLSIEELLLNPQSQLQEYKTAFDLDKPLNLATIEDYHQRNIQTIEQTFNMSWNVYRNSKWIFILKDYVKTQCPDRY